MHWGRKHRHQSFLKKGGGITLVLGAAFAALESDGSVDGSDETDGELDGATFVLDTALGRDSAKKSAASSAVLAHHQCIKDLRGD